MTTFSFSQVSTYQQCPKKYQFHYVERIKTKEFETSYELILWSLVHQSLEWRYQQMFPKEKSLFCFPIIPTKQELLQFFSHHREKETRDETKIRENTNYSKEDIYHRAERYLSKYYDSHQNISEIQDIETEKEILFTLPNGQSFKWIIDRLDILKDGTLVINDYKTGKKLPTEKDLSYRNQLSLYAYALAKLYGKKTKIKARLYYLHFDIEEEREISSEYIDTLVQQYQESTSEIETKRREYFQDKTTFPTQESSLCSYCEYQSSCPLRKRKYLEQKTEIEQKITPIIDEYATISKQITQYKQQADQNKKLILNYMEQQNLSKLEVENILLSTRTTKTIEIPNIEDLETYLYQNNLRESTSSITRYKIASLLSEWIVEKSDFGEIIENNPFPVLSVARMR